MRKMIMVLVVIFAMGLFIGCDAEQIQKIGDELESLQEKTEEIVDVVKDPQEDKDVVLTIDNSPDLKHILTESATEDEYLAFGKKYLGRIIEFDGYIADVAKYKEYKTRFNVLTYKGNAGQDNGVGPAIQLSNVANRTDVITIYGVGTNVKIKASVGSYDKNSGLFDMTAVELKSR